ncbi:MAG: response regulator [Planctomycetes bacterium]|nr:response regulator [Planctomycetota bacterium]MCP4838584.1 response regulator [Planctomycetota bacterium]
MQHAIPHSGTPRLNLLLSYGGWREHAAVKQIPRLLEPMGIHALEADTGEEAASLIKHKPVHIAVVDLEIPLHQDHSGGIAGPRILQLLRRLDPAPPTIVVRPRQASGREDSRGLATSLREGAFAVIDRPLHLEVLLQTLRRVLRRHYHDTWPSTF